MANATPAVQISVVDAATNPQNNISAQAGGIPLYCATGVVMQDVTLAPSSSNVALAFPAGVTAATLIYISAITASDLVVKVGVTNPVSLSVPAKQGLLLYGLTSAGISLNTALGGQVQYAVGG